MYYRTIFNNQITIEQVYNNTVSEPTKYTVRNESDPPINNIRSSFNYTMLKNALAAVTDEFDMSYTEYNIPKATGGYRLISAPNPTLKTLQRTIYDTLIALGATATDNAFAYESNRTVKDAMVRHQRNNSQYFYKFDISNFFPSCTPEILKTNLEKVYPICCFEEDILDKLIYVAVHNNALPQGSPLSPLLSNLIMTEFDYTMHYIVYRFTGVYTRYADDIIISFKEKHELDWLQNIIQNRLATTISPDLHLNTEKSKCGSIAGRNWHLGIMLNKDNKLTIGHKRHMELKAKINNFIFDFTNQNYWSIINTQRLQGELNWFKSIEPEYADFCIKRLEQKHNTQITLHQMMCRIIKGEVG